MIDLAICRCRIHTNLVTSYCQISSSLGTLAKRGPDLQIDLAIRFESSCETQTSDVDALQPTYPGDEFFHGQRWHSLCEVNK